MSWLHGLRHRVRVLVAPGRYADEQAEERRSHAAMELTYGPAGEQTPDPGPHDPNPFGPADEEQRPMRLSVLERLLQDVRFALRGMRRAPAFTAMVVVTLALGVSANAAVFSLLDRVFGQPPAGVSAPDEVRRLYIEMPDHSLQPGLVFPAWSYPAFAAVRDGAPSGTNVIAWTEPNDDLMRVGGAELEVERSAVTHDYFEVLGVDAARGRLFGDGESSLAVPTPVVVITHSLWTRAFGGDPDVVGRSIELEGRPLTVVGVTEAGFSGLELSRTEVFYPLNMFQGSAMRPGLAWYEDAGNYMRAAARVAPDIGETALMERLTPAYRFEQVLPAGDTPDGTENVMTGSILEALGPADRDQEVSISMRIAGVTAIVLLIACANIASLLLVRARQRRREIGVRLALGVSGRRLLGQLLTESLALALLAGAAAVLVAMVGGEVLRRVLLPEILWAEPAVGFRTVAFALATAVGAGLLAGIAPAAFAARVEVGSAMKTGARDGGARRSPLRAALLVSQAALSVVLLAGAGLFIRSLENVTSLPLGYDVEEVASFRVPLTAGDLADRSTMDEVAEHLRGLPGVSSVALSMSAPMAGSAMTQLALPGLDSLPRLSPTDRGPSFNRVTPEFFEVAGVDVVAGRAFTASDGPDVVMVNQTMADTYWPGRSAIGQCVLIGGTDESCSYVVGVVENVRLFEVIEEPTLQYFRPLPEGGTARAVVMRIQRGGWNALSPAIGDVIDDYFDPRAVGTRRMMDQLEPQLRPWRLGARLFTAFSALALLVTIVGVYSVTAYSVSQRTHEMGVRIALGARLADLLRLVAGEGARVVAVGVVLGIGVALLLGRLVESLLFGVTPRDPVAMTLAAVVLLAAGVGASLVPAYRAGTVEPVRALSTE